MVTDDYKPFDMTAQLVDVVIVVAVIVMAFVFQ